jgi:N-carbamoylputrescine amidase
MDKQLRVGVVQMDCCVGDILGNLAHAEELVEATQQQGAQIVLLPELMPSGYTLTEKIWDYAEPFAGPTVAWLTHMAKRLDIYLGTTFLEADGEDFFNTFALASPGGTIAGRVRKSPPASLEAFFYRAGNSSHVIDTEVGRLGVGICYENLLFERLYGLFQASVDLVLQPSAAGRPKPMKPGDEELFDRMIERSAPHYARTLGVPVAMANRTGAIDTDLPGGYGEFHSSFPGLSRIVDSDGKVKAKLGQEEGVLVAEVKPNPAHKKRKKPRCFKGMWALPMPWFAYIWPETQLQGEQAYQNNDRRKERALAISSPEHSAYRSSGSSCI